MLRQDAGTKKLHIQWIQAEIINPGVRTPNSKTKRSPQSSAKERNSEAVPPFLHTPSWHAQGGIYLLQFQIIQHRDVICQLVCIITIFLSEGVAATMV